MSKIQRFSHFLGSYVSKIQNVASQLFGKLLGASYEHSRYAVKVCTSRISQYISHRRLNF